MGIVKNYKPLRMNSFRFVLRTPMGKTFSFTDHLCLDDKSKEWYITWVMNRWLGYPKTLVVWVVGLNKYTLNPKVGWKGT